MDTGRRTVHSQAPSGELPRVAYALQERTHQGPCLDAVYEQRTVRVADMSTETRWPDFARGAAEAGAASMLSFQLFVEGDNLGALNLYSRTRNAFRRRVRARGPALRLARRGRVRRGPGARPAHPGAGTRNLIGQAKGILWERHRISGDQAFGLLSRVSQDTNRGLRDVAEHLVRALEDG